MMMTADAEAVAAAAADGKGGESIESKEEQPPLSSPSSTTSSRASRGYIAYNIRKSDYVFLGGVITTYTYYWSFFRVTFLPSLGAWAR